MAIFRGDNSHTWHLQSVPREPLQPEEKIFPRKKLSEILQRQKSAEYISVKNTSTVWQYFVGTIPIHDTCNLSQERHCSPGQKIFPRKNCQKYFRGKNPQNTFWLKTLPYFRNISWGQFPYMTPAICPKSAIAAPERKSFQGKTLRNTLEAKIRRTHFG